MFIFRTIFQPWALSSYIPAAERGLFTHYACSSRLFHLLNLALENMDECFWSINRDRKLCLCRSHCHQNVVLQTTAKKLKFKLIIPELVVLILQAKPLEKKKKIRNVKSHFPVLSSSRFTMLLFKLLNSRSRTFVALTIVSKNRFKI